MAVPASTVSSLPWAFDLLEVHKPLTQHSRTRASSRTDGCRARFPSCTDKIRADAVRGASHGATNRGQRSRGAVQRRTRPVREVQFRAPTTDAPPSSDLKVSSEEDQQLKGYSASFVSSLVDSAFEELRVEETCVIDAECDCGSEPDEDDEVCDRDDTFEEVLSLASRDEQEIQEEAALEAARMIMQKTALIQPTRELLDELSKPASLARQPAVQKVSAAQLSPSKAAALIPVAPRQMPPNLLPSGGQFMCRPPTAVGAAPKVSEEVKATPQTTALPSTQPWHMKPSVGSWVQLRRPATKAPAAAEASEAQAVVQVSSEANVPTATAARSWNMKPSVGSWVLPLPKAPVAETSPAASSPETTVAAEEPKRSWCKMASVGSWLQAPRKLLLPSPPPAPAAPAPVSAAKEVAAADADRAPDLHLAEVRKYMRFAWQRAAAPAPIEVATGDDDDKMEQEEASPAGGPKRLSQQLPPLRSPALSPSSSQRLSPLTTLPAGSPGNAVRTKRAMGISASLTQLCPEAPAGWTVPFASSSRPAPAPSTCRISPTTSRSNAPAMLLDLGVEGSASPATSPARPTEGSSLDRPALHRVTKSPGSAGVSSRTLLTPLTAQRHRLAAIAYRS